MITTQTIYFTMVHHPTRGTIRAGNACMTRKAAQQWLPMKTTRNSPRARAERVAAKRFLRLERTTAPFLGSVRCRCKRCCVKVPDDLLRAWHKSLRQLYRFSELGFITKEGFKAWDAL